MKLRIVLLCLLSRMLAFGTDLDAPGEKKVTLGSEIQRGAEAVEAVGTSGNLLNFSERYSRLIAENRQSNTDTEGFSLGAEAKMAFYMDIRLDVLRDATDPLGNTVETVNMAIDFTVQWFKEFRQKQAQLGIQDEKMADLLGIKLDSFQKRVAAWESKYPEIRATAAAPPKDLSAQSQQQAVTAFPELAVSGSALNSAFLERVKKYRVDNPGIFQDPEWPMKIAKEVAGVLDHR